MGRTLFVYIFKDLAKLFVLASLALSGIMSFGGLLRPLTKQGLDLVQAGLVLAYLLPAMSTYALPIAALFSTTMVYGRLAADNELTACRAGGISYLAVAAPALCLGLIVAILSLLLLCFIVPLFMLSVERVIYSNLAGVICAGVQRNHEVVVGNLVIYADNATVLPSPRPDTQYVRLDYPTLITYENVTEPGARPVRVPKDFWMARSALAYIETRRQDSVPEPRSWLSVRLEDGIKFPRDERGGMKINIGSTDMAQIEVPMQLREAAKFMDIMELKRQYSDPAISRRVRDILNRYTQADIERALRDRMTAALARNGEISFDSRPYQHLLHAPPAALRAFQRGGEVNLAARSPSTTDFPVVFVERKREGGDETAYRARGARITAEANMDEGRAQIMVRLQDTLGDKGARFTELSRSFSIPLPPAVNALRSRTLTQYLEPGALGEPERDLLTRGIMTARNRVLSEVHGRAAFGISCLILVMIGSALGIMFRSGNFLSAFAVSALPGLLCMALIVTGQHTAEHIADSVSEAARSLRAGLILIWSGNALVLAAAVLLSWRMQRQ